MELEPGLRIQYPVNAEVSCDFSKSESTFET
jgi:hypothetical protein